MSAVLVRPMTSSDAVDIARLRAETAEGGLLGRLGPGPVVRFMWLAADDPDTFGDVAVEDGRVIGFILCTTASIRLQRRAVRSTPGLWLRVPLLAVRDPRLLKLGAGRLVRLFRRRPVSTSDEPELRLFDIAVASPARGRGVGRALIDAALANAQVRGHRAIGLTVLRDNTSAIRLYEAVGFARHRAGTRDDGRAYFTMRRTLGEAPPAVESATRPGRRHTKAAPAGEGGNETP